MDSYFFRLIGSFCYTAYVDELYPDIGLLGQQASKNISKFLLLYAGLNIIGVS
jgi:hypothetical protein